MWIVKLALQRPYTFIVLALLVLLATPVVLLRTPTDILPEINIPVVSVVWEFSGMAASDMADRITSPFERVLTTAVNDIEHIESQSFRGRAVVKIFFHPITKIELALSQVTALAQVMLRSLPPGISPPLIVTYRASSVPVIQLVLSSSTLSESEVFDLGMNFVRPQLAVIPGAGVPYPYGGKPRAIVVDIDLNKLRSRGLSPEDVVNAVSAQNLIIPGGTVKIGTTEYDVNINVSTPTVSALNSLPVKTVDGSVITIGDVAHVRDGYQDQTNAVRRNGQHAMLLSIIKTGATSTLEIVNRVHSLLPLLRKQLPLALNIQPIFDQSIFVRAAISGVLKEASIAALFTAAMILVFLANWRATLIIAVSIPLSILCSIIALSALGETINLMTLGGLALAVGILVDDATVTIENIDSHLDRGKSLQHAILDGAHQIAVPAFVSTICICIVFVPMFLLAGVTRYLFIPLAEAVVFAMLASYFWSRTLVPTLAMYLLKPGGHGYTSKEAKGWIAPLIRFQHKFEQGFSAMKQGYLSLLNRALSHRKLFLSYFLGGCFASLLLLPLLGQDFFPEVDGGQIRMHVRVKTGTRIEETARICDEVEKRVRTIIPDKDLADIVDNIGLPYSGINTSYQNNGTFGPGDAEILISLKSGHSPTANYVKRLRAELPRFFPGISFFFQPADIVGQILNFGLPAPIDVQIKGYKLHENLAVASKLQNQMRAIPGIADVHIQQAFDQPELFLEMDRTKASLLGLTQQDVASSVLISLSGSFQTRPTFWLNPKNGVVYNVITKVPYYHLESLQDLENLPVRAESLSSTPSQLLSNLGKMSRKSIQGIVTHNNVMPVIEIYAATEGRDLGGVAREIHRLVDQIRPELPRGSMISVRGQVETMQSSFMGLGIGVMGAIILVYMLIVVNFQSWLDPFIIITALPGALAGISWMLFLTGTRISIPALMGTVMCMGVATANSILMISFAKEILQQIHDPVKAALEAASGRIRPILMTALAMILGMIPMALGIGEGGEHNAPLARAVIGGLLVATISTLFFVPTVFAFFHRNFLSPASNSLKEDASGASSAPSPV